MTWSSARLMWQQDLERKMPKEPADPFCYKAWIKSDEDSEDKKSEETELSITLVTKKFADTQKDALKDYHRSLQICRYDFKGSGELAEDAEGLGLYEDAGDARGRS